MRHVISLFCPCFGIHAGSLGTASRQQPAQAGTRPQRRGSQLVQRMLVAILLSMLASAANDIAAAGALDPTYGTDGLATLSFSNSPFDTGAHAMVRLPDDRIVTVGLTPADVHGNGGAALARFTPQGTLDQTFGTNGRVTTDFSGFGVNLSRVPSALLRQTDGNLVVGGGAVFTTCGFRCNSTYYFLLARYNTDGGLDATFGDGGVVLLPLGFNAHIEALAQQADGKIVAVGQSGTSAFAAAFTVARFNTDGNLDQRSFGPDGQIQNPGFGSDGAGVVYLNFDSGVARANQVAMQPDGKIVVTGAHPNSAIPAVLARFDVNGVLDASFGTGGWVTAGDVVNGEVVGHGVTALALQPDGKILLSGVTIDGGDFAVSRFNPDGSRDTGFGLNSVVTTDLGGTDVGQAMTLQSDGEIVVAGYTNLSSSTYFFALARYNPNGSLDSTFGINGTVVTTELGPTSLAYGVVEVANGKLVAGGYAVESGLNDIALARYIGESTPPTADLALTQANAPNPVQVGQALTYTLTMTNNGPSPAANAALDDTIPASTTFQALTAPAGWSCTTPAVGSTGTVHCSTATLDVAATASFTLVVQVSGAAAGTTLSNTVTTSSTTTDPNSANNSTDPNSANNSATTRVYFGPPTNKDQCQNGGWQRFDFPRMFKNQGDCIQFVNTGK